MGRRFGESYFGEVSDRLRRFLAIDGEFPVKPVETVQPVVIVGDVDRTPGLSPFVGRHWMGNFGGIGGAATGPTLQADSQAVIVDRIWIGTSIASTLQLRFGVSPGGGTDQSLIIDNATTIGERAGLFNQVVGFVAAGGVLGTWQFAAAGTSLQIELGLYLPRGMCLQWCQTAGAPTFFGSAYGRVAQQL